MRRSAPQQTGPAPKRANQAAQASDPPVDARLEAWCKEQRSSALITALVEWREAHTGFRRIQESFFRQDGEYPDAQYAEVRIVQAAMRLLPSGVVLYHATVAANWKHRSEWWLPTSLTPRGAKASKAGELFAPRIYKLHVEQGVTGVWAGDLDGEYDNEKEVVLNCGLQLRRIDSDSFAVSVPPVPAAATPAAVSESEVDDDDGDDDDGEYDRGRDVPVSTKERCGIQ